MTGQERWLLEPLDRPLDVNLPDEGSQWDHHMRVALSEVVNYGALSQHRQLLEVPWGRPVKGIEYALRNSTLRSRLWITIPEYRVLIVGDGADDETQIAPWVHAVTQAAIRMSHQHPKFRWAAIIGPSPSGLGHAQELTATTMVGPLQLRPGGVRLVEYTRTERPGLYSRNLFWSWPAIVEGTSSGYNWNASTQSAMRDLARLCALLSVSWRSAWQVREGPIEGDGSSITIPEYSPLEQHIESDENVLRTAVSAPEWANKGWEVLAANRAAANAVTAYYEGLLVQEDHPSLALLAYVAAVEAVGRELRPPIRRPSQRFRQALRFVASEQEVDVLMRAYGARSETVHEAAIHGSEIARGAPSLPNFFGLDPFSRFELEMVGQLERLSRNLLHLVLKEELISAKPLSIPADADPFDAWPKGVIAMTAAVESFEIRPK